MDEKRTSKSVHSLELQTTSSEAQRTLKTNRDTQGFSHVLFEALYHFHEGAFKDILFSFIRIVMFRSCWCMVPNLRWCHIGFSGVECAFTLSSFHPFICCVIVWLGYQELSAVMTTLWCE
ncbi:hypothetical protein H671_5g14452 [Cricetulus griseus]|nr:hypothetical protein H671_5g14452 [Cricetulus griseus]